MVKDGQTLDNRNKDIYILTIHDDTVYDKVLNPHDIVNGEEIHGPYFKVE